MGGSRLLWVTDFGPPRMRSPQNVILDRHDIRIDYQHSPGGHPCHLHFSPGGPHFSFWGEIGPKLGGKGHFGQFWAKIAYGGPPGEICFYFLMHLRHVHLFEYDVMGVRAPCAAPVSPQFGHFPPEKAYFGEISHCGGQYRQGGPPGENLS